MSTIAIRLLTSCAALLLIAAASPDQGRVGYVIDGDTFRLESGERIRIAGIDTPETQKGTGEMQCGDRTRSIRNGACPDTARWPDHHDRSSLGRSYNRTVVRVTLAGRDVGSELVASGVARWWPRRQPKPDWCARSRF